MAGKADPLFFAVIDRERRKPAGVASLMRIAPEAGSIEVGISPGRRRLQRTRAAARRSISLPTWCCGAPAVRVEVRRAQPAEPAGGGADGVFLEGCSGRRRWSRGAPRHRLVRHDRRRLALPEARVEAWLEPANFDAAGRQQGALRDLTRPAGWPGPALMARRGPLKRWQRRWKDGWVSDLDEPRGAAQRENRHAGLRPRDAAQALAQRARSGGRGLAVKPAGPGHGAAIGGAGVQGDPEFARGDRVRVVP